MSGTIFPGKFLSGLRPPGIVVSLFDIRKLTPPPSVLANERQTHTVHTFMQVSCQQLAHYHQNNTALVCAVAVCAAGWWASDCANGHRLTTGRWEVRFPFMPNLKTHRMALPALQTGKPGLSTVCVRRAGRGIL